MHIPAFLRNAQRFLSSNSPEILTAIGVVGTVTTAYLTGQASVKAFQLVRDEEHKLESFRPQNTHQLEAREILELTWKLYIPPVASGLLTIVAVVAANRVQNNRAAVVAAAYTLSERAYSQYREKVAETIGVEREKDIRDEISHDVVKRNPLGDREVIITGTGDVLCYDSFTGRYFQSSMETLRRAENDINFEVLNQGYASLSDFYSMLGLAPTVISDQIGWNTENRLDLRTTAVLSQDGRPCLSVDFNYQPKHNFDKFGY